MEIQTKHLPHYQFKYYKLKCIVIGQLIVLGFFIQEAKMLPLVQIAVLEEIILQNGFGWFYFQLR